jgi:tetratricopeptide (TPR) repeat protein
MLQRLFERSSSIDDLSRAININEQAFGSVSATHPNYGIFAANLAGAFLLRFDCLGTLGDNDRAIELIQSTVDFTPPTHLFRTTCLNILGSSLLRRFQTTGKVDDLDQAVLISREAVDSTEDIRPDKPIYLSTLGSALMSRFEQTASIMDLNEAIVVKELAVRLIRPNHLEYAKTLNNLGNSLQKRFERTGSLGDLDRAIKSSGDALKLLKEAPDSVPVLSNLAAKLQARFEWTGSMDDLDRAIEAMRNAIKLTPEDNPNMAMYLTNLGTALHRRYERMGNRDELNLAIAKYAQAVRSTPTGHPNRMMYCNNLGSALFCKSELDGENCLDEAITTLAEAVNLSGHANHPDRPAYLKNYGVAMQERSEKTASLDDLNTAIECFQDSVQLTPRDHPERTSRLDKLGDAFARRFELTDSIDDLERAFDRKEEAVECKSAPPSIRLKAAASCTKLLITHERYARSKPILKTAVGLLPAVSPRWLKRKDQEYNISQYSDITSRAVSIFIATGEDVYEALRTLELGRGILANLQLELRSDISDLAESQPELANRFCELRDLIDSPAVSSTSGLSYPSSLTDFHRAAISEFDELLISIRSLDEGFLKGPTKSEMQRLAHDKTIVVLNTSEVRSDAFLVTENAINCIHLHKLTMTCLQDHVDIFVTAIADHRYLSRYNKARLALNKVLQWLWDSAVKPILTRLALCPRPSVEDNPPRVCWVGSRLTNILPIHAAGYNDLASENTLDWVVSSYSPTIKALSFAEENALVAKREPRDEKIIVVSMPTTLENEPLPNVLKEVEELKRLLSESAICIEVRQNPTRKQILTELTNYTIAHFACHGESRKDPSQSRLLLHDWKAHPLTVADIMSLKVRGAKFAYLSACNTSTTEDRTLLDEHLSLTAAMQLSGFPSVVGTLWSVRDAQSVEVARDVYGFMSVGPDLLDTGRAAIALHNAVRALREKTRRRSRGQSDPLIWGPYISTGI